ncbi:hypothetical protein IFM89_021789 [Coptis chinensis]|uniref:Uncharacterized protein n=1 Tax=Coptis chinensis TaxID=261450 RepID=A0A835IM46_9MAGN|nr:hypothetical protein IFM89_021789 [Coptis chinensis]
MLTFARICIDINADKELPASIKLKSRNGNIYKILLEFPWNPLICTECKEHRHEKVTDEPIIEATLGSPSVRNLNAGNKFATLANDTTLIAISDIVQATTIRECAIGIEPQQDSLRFLQDKHHQIYEALVNTSEDECSNTIDSEVANDTTLVAISDIVQATTIRECAIGIEPQQDSLRFLQDKHHQIYEALVNTSEDECSNTIDSEVSREKENDFFNDHIILVTNQVEGTHPQDFVEVTSENLAVTPLINGD